MPCRRHRLHGGKRRKRLSCPFVQSRVVDSVRPRFDGCGHRLAWRTYRGESWVFTMNRTRDNEFEECEMEPGGSFYVRAPSINAVRRALHRAPGGVRVVGRHDRETILCTHTMDEHSLARHWPVIVSRLEKAGLSVVRSPVPGTPVGPTHRPGDRPGD